MLSRIVEWYNELKTTTVECEFDLIASEMGIIDSKLEFALQSSTWCDYDQIFIDDVHSDLKKLHRRVMKTKENIERLVKNMRDWGKLAMYRRKDDVPTALIQPEDLFSRVKRRVDHCLGTKDLIDTIMDENYKYFFNISFTPKPKIRSPQKFVSITSKMSRIDQPSNDIENDKSFQVFDSVFSTRPVSTASAQSETQEMQRSPSQVKLFRPYQEYVDNIIARELVSAIKESMRYLKVEMENGRGQNAPVFEIRLELQIPDIVFIPSLEFWSKYGLMATIENMILQIYNMSTMIPRITQPSEPQLDEAGERILQDFSYILEDNKDISNMKNDILTLAQKTIKEAVTFADKMFSKYNFLWLDDRQDKLQEFITYGRSLTQEELEKMREDPAFSVEEKEPTLEAFRNKIDYYIELSSEISELEVHHIFYVWLSVDMRSIKQAILNLDYKWSHTFKEYLKKEVISSLKNLEEFIANSTKTLELEVTNDDYDTLLEVLIVLDNIAKSEDKTDNLFDHLKEIVDLLKSYDVTFDDKIYNQVSYSKSIF
jgi:dynein heavy chain